jgi:hypothetical protein
LRIQKQPTAQLFWNYFLSKIVPNGCIDEPDQVLLSQPKFKEKVMSSNRLYVKPELTVHGNVETITQQGGFSNTDVPAGTPVGPAGVVTVAS